MCQTKSFTGVAIFLVCVLPFVLSSCQGPVEVSREPSVGYQINRLLVLPFKDMMRAHGENATLRNPISGKVFTTGKVEEDADVFLLEQLLLKLNERKDLYLIPASQAQGVLARLLSESKTEPSELELTVKTGKALRADAVLVGYLYCFRDRAGRNYTVDTPASVVFSLDLIQVKDAKVIWGSHYNETQRSLSDDLFQIGKFIKRKGKWITVREMAVSGIEEVFQTFPKP